MDSDDSDAKKPVVKTYEGMKAANEAQQQFEREHAEHRTAQAPISDNLIITRCLDCGVEFREYYTTGDPSVTSN